MADPLPLQCVCVCVARVLCRAAGMRGFARLLTPPVHFLWFPVVSCGFLWLMSGVADQSGLCSCWCCIRARATSLRQETDA
eukprot:15440259-Alexandrium_andersonii.AAC.2